MVYGIQSYGLRRLKIVFSVQSLMFSVQCLVKKWFSRYFVGELRLNLYSLPQFHIIELAIYLRKEECRRHLPCKF